MLRQGNNDMLCKLIALLQDKRHKLDISCADSLRPTFQCSLKDILYTDSYLYVVETDSTVHVTIKTMYDNRLVPIVTFSNTEKEYKQECFDTLEQYYYEDQDRYKKRQYEILTDSLNSVI